MKICRYDEHRVGLVEGDTVRDVTPVLEALGPFTYPLPKYDLLVASLESSCAPSWRKRPGQRGPLRSSRGSYSGRSPTPASSSPRR